jgi:hypothetical protein
LGLVLVVKSSEDLFMSLPKPKVRVLRVFVVYCEAGFEEAVGISFYQIGDMLNSLKFVIKMHRIDCERALDCSALINILLLAFGHAILAGVESVGVAGLASSNLGCIGYFAYLGRELSYGILGND